MPDAFKFDPFMLLRESLNRLEGGINTYATAKMQSEQFSRALAQFMKVSLAGQHVFARALAGLYVRLDLPSRTELAALAAAVQRVEDKVDVLLPPAPSLAPRPARTRRAPTPAPAVAADVSPKVARTIQKPASAKRSAAKPTTSRARTTKRQAA